MTTPSPQTHEVTLLLAEVGDGHESALARLAPLVYDELHQLARRLMSGESAGHTLQATALVNEAYLRLVDQRDVRWQNRAHFFAVAAQMMRRILVDHARARRYQKRGGEAAQRVALEEALLVSDEQAAELVALDEALAQLARFDPRRARVVELRFFGGLSVEETAHILHVSPNTVIRDWSLAKAWLYKEVMNDE